MGAPVIDVRIVWVLESLELQVLALRVLALQVLENFLC